MSETVHLQLPYLDAAQAQKHVTHNEALSLIDAIVQLSVISRTLTAPPVSPLEGDRYLVAAAATGAWAGHSGAFAFRLDGTWRFVLPRVGWQAWCAAEATLLIYDGVAWNSPGIPSTLQNLALLGVNTTADAANKLSVASANVLLTHAGSDQRLKINKAAAGNTASLLFQDGFSGRAEFGLTGDDDFHLKVSADGAAWFEALTVNSTNGVVSLPQGLSALPVFTAAARGLAPLSGGGTANYLRADGAWAAPPGDVIGPAGAADNALTRFDTATGKLLQSSGVLVSDAGELSLPAVAAPAVPVAGAATAFAQNVGGRQMLAFRAPAGLERPVQPFLGRGRVFRWSAAGGNGVSTADGSGAAVVTGTATARTIAATRFYTAVRKLGYASVATAGGSSGVIPHSVLAFWRGNAAGLGGFHATMTFGAGDAAAVADARMFAGFTASAAAIGNVNPSSLLNIVGVGCDSAQTTLRIMTNDGAGVATAIDLGVNFPANTISTDLYELVLFAPPNGASIDYRVTRLNTGHVASGTLSADLPVNTQFLTPQVWRNNGVTALAVAVDVSNIYVETDY